VANCQAGDGKDIVIKEQKLEIIQIQHWKAAKGRL